MTNKWKESEYQKLVRIKEDKLNWLKENKGKLTIAGFLDKIINKHKCGKIK